jgi:hypothetical protein
MNTRMNPVRKDLTPRARLAAVNRLLRDVHGSLVRAVQEAFERLHGRVSGSVALLALVLDDPLFAWLRPMSALIAELDELADDGERDVDRVKLAAIRTTIERWTSITGEADEFAESYRIFLQTDPGVVLAHAALKQALAAIPRA